MFLRARGESSFFRNPNKPQGNTWDIPGGKIDQGETPKEAVVREFYEETGVTLDSKDLEYSGKVFITSEKADFVFHYKWMPAR